jgi:pSer/pThr/pTyr-binding forkhead associated (FHA) protein
MRVVCPTCDYKNRPDNRFCTQCGTKLQSPETLVPRLTVLQGKETIAVYTLSGTKNIIGREMDNDVIVDDEKISRKHAIIYEDEGEYWIEDLNSKNGVFLNGKQITGRERLIDGYLLKLGTTILRFEHPL